VCGICESGSKVGYDFPKSTSPLIVKSFDEAAKCQMCFYPEILPKKHKNRPMVGYATGSLRGQASKCIPALIAPIIKLKSIRWIILFVVGYALNDYIGTILFEEHLVMLVIRRILKLSCRPVPIQFIKNIDLIW